MKRDSTSGVRLGIGALTLALGVGWAVGSPSSARAEEKGETPGIRAAARHVPRHHGGRSLEERVAMLSKALHLDERQQSELRKVLEEQREQVSRVWTDPSVPAAYRVSATQAITDKTADKIRALLNEDQKKLYNPPRRPRDATEGSTRPSAEAWMQPSQAR